MKKVIWISVIFLSGLAVEFLYLFFKHPMMNSKFVLNKKELNETVAKAQDGDCKSMDKLYWHYDTLNEKYKSKVWLEKWEKSGCK